MDVSSINSDLIRGNVTTIILKALLAEDRYGYDILREIEVKSAGQYKLKQPTLYSCLKRLEKQGLISSYWGAESDTEGGRRRYYALTDAGKSYLNKMQSEYEYSRTILDSLLSEEKFDFENTEAPFDINSLRPYTKRADDDDVKDAKETPVTDEKVIEEKPQTTKMFAPLDKGNGSYDNDYRHTTSSVSDMLGKIDDILNNKPEEKKEEVKEEIIEEKIKEEKPVETPIEEPKTIIYNTPVEKTEISPEEQSRRDAAKAFLYGKQEDKPIEEPVKEEKIIEEKPQEEPKNTEINAKEYLFGKKEESLPKYDENHINSANLLFDKYKKSDDVVEPEPEVKYDPKDIFYKYQPQQETQPQNNTFDEVKPQIIEEKQEKTYKAEEIFDKYKKKDEPIEHESAKVTLEASPVPPANTFSFRQDKETNVNYRDAFSVLRTVENKDEKSEFIQKPVAPAQDLKTKLFAGGYKLRTYSRENTENYYSLNYIKKNKINRDCYALMYVLICLEVLIGWAIFKDRFTPMAYAAVCIIGLIVPIVPFVIWTMNPDKRVHANYSFKTSILNRLMLYLNCLVLVLLIGFFGLNANISDGNTVIGPILCPALLLLNIPLSTVVYTLLYKTKKYHIS